ncbi:FlgM family anti-sigma-28 factor [Rhodovulum bhavnagarense]|uniref:Negative regulator of flagellin synthesis n=1 Tax=Rhodovulum bhavnagarense TaxID=992286 RepID=A0A4R2RD47_9RHOB|nr:flagellar biosynthesis anti-sigma factor FlgM [Rhodovulum bhavnagarense]TCP61360.1 FlgM family anti-sigma-28 factor [Rhodovulum bhavnagarense]
MVDSLGPMSGRPKTQRIANDPAETPGTQVQRGPAASRAVPVTAGDQVSLSQEARQLPAGLEAGPPLDLPLVKKIKDAITEGRYPINYDRIADSLFESYQEMMR